LRDYELVLLLRPDTEDEGLDRAVERVSTFVSGRGGEVTDVDRWGRRKLAYPIDRNFEGQYVVTQLRMEPQDTRELESTIRLTEEVMRHLLVRKDEE
jgi:small subunit ribosomal protein S6